MGWIVVRFVYLFVVSTGVVFDLVIMLIWLLLVLLLCLFGWCGCLAVD